MWLLVLRFPTGFNIEALRQSGILPPHTHRAHNRKWHRNIMWALTHVVSGKSVIQIYVVPPSLAGKTVSKRLSWPTIWFFSHSPSFVSNPQLIYNLQSDEVLNLSLIILWLPLLFWPRHRFIASCCFVGVSNFQLCGKEFLLVGIRDKTVVSGWRS